MRPLAQTGQAKRPSPDEIKGLERALDKAYARLRARAEAAWKRHHSGNEPADASVSVRISMAKKKSDFTAASKARPNLKARALATKKSRARKRVPRAKGRANRNRRGAVFYGTVEYGRSNDPVVALTFSTGPLACGYGC